MTLNIHFEGRPILQSLRQGTQFFQIWFGDRGNSIIEFDVAEFFSTPRDSSEKTKGRSCSFGNEIDDDLQNNCPNAELWIIQTSGNGNIQFDFAFAVFQKSNR